MTKDVDTDKYYYSGFGVSFFVRGIFSLPDGSFGKGVIIFSGDMTSTAKFQRKGSDHTTLTAEVEYSINFSEQRNKFSLSLHYNESNSYLFVYATKIYQFNANDSWTTAYMLCLENILKHFSVENIKKTGLNVYAYDLMYDLLTIILLRIVIVSIFTNILWIEII